MKTEARQLRRKRNDADVRRILARFVGESGAASFLRYARRQGYVDTSTLEALESSLRELFGSGSSVIFRAIEAEIALINNPRAGAGRVASSMFRNNDVRI